MILRYDPKVSFAAAFLIGFDKSKALLSHLQCGLDLHVLLGFWVPDSALLGIEVQCDEQRKVKKSKSSWVMISRR